jgi:hypothetical protein
MTHNQRNRLTVTLGGNWRIWSNTIPAGSRALGTVSRDGIFSDSGVLVQIESTGIYAQINAGVLRTLPQSKVAAAIEAARAGAQGGPGRGQGAKAADGATGLKRVNVSLDEASIETLRKFGDGELSLGIRRAAAHIKSAL